MTGSGRKASCRNGSGRVLPVEDMSPEGKRAYLRWLQDPAVQQATWNEFSPDKSGKDDQGPS